MKYFNFIAAVLLSLLYAIGRIPPSEKYNLWFTIFIIPVAMVCNTVLLIGTLSLRRRSSLFYIIPMIIGVPYMLSTVGIKRYFKNNATDQSTFTVLNHNISNFLIKPHEFTDIDSARIALKNMVVNPKTDIQCYQEFITAPWMDEFNVIDQLKKSKLNFYFSQAEDRSHAWNATTGILIVSKFPIVSHGDVLASPNGFNRVAYADIKIREDTVRIINVHLESMGLGRYDPRYQSDLSHVKNNTLTILSHLKFGVFERSKQVKQVAAFIEESPYPVICAGDFNDMPYSYSYQYLKSRMKNAFEESGTGFGFTYNGGTLKMLRIDNQFYSGSIRSIDLKTRHDLKFTDHFPLEGEYEILH